MSKPKHNLPMRIYACMAENIMSEPIICTGEDWNELNDSYPDKPIGSYELVQVMHPNPKKPRKKK